jgi:hypothetical protein
LKRALPQQILINTSIKVLNNRDKKAKQLRDKNTCTKYQMLASILQNQNQTPHTAPKNPPKGSAKQPSEVCFQCGNKGHWAKSSPNPHPPTRPCPNMDNGDTGGWTVFRENIFFLAYSLKFLIAPSTEDPIPMFPLGD